MSENRSIGQIIIAIILAVLALIGGFFGLNLLGDEGFDAPQGSGSGAPPVIIEPEISDPNNIWYEVYFTNPTCPDEELRTGGLDEVIADDLSFAEVQIDIAAFDLDSEPLIEALIAARQRDVNVRVVVDNEHTPESTINRLRRNGMSVVTDDRSALMHNKFILIDGRILWTGSMNFSSNGVFCNNNNVVRIDSPRLVSNYLAEMDEMYLERVFGPKSPENTQFTFQVNGVEIENYFAAEDELAPIIGRVIARADEEILFMAFSFTSDDIGEQLMERGEAGLSIRGVFETTGATSRYSYYNELLAAELPNIDVRRDGNPRIMHHKVFILDRKTVVFGSYNFTGNANDSNDENILIVHDREFAQFFVEEFEFVWSEARIE
ncbi:MAG: phospholipase D-like domain-containing protein [Anaerolineae bacterium]